MIGTRVGSKSAFSGSVIGSGADDEGTSNSMAGVTQDATSGIFTPGSLAEWNQALAVAGIASGGPSFLWNCQEASGSLTDSISGANLTVAGTPTYAATVPGWSRKGITMADGTSTNFSSVSAALPNIATQSFLILAIIANNSAPAATRNGLTMGTTTAAIGPVITTNVMRCVSNANTASGASALPTTPILAGMRVNRTAASQAGFTLQDKIVPTFATTLTGQKFTLGPTSAASNAPPWTFLQVVGFQNGAAELSDAQLKVLYQTLNWNPLWT